jgi:hypothetical protein
MSDVTNMAARPLRPTSYMYREMFDLNKNAETDSGKLLSLQCLACHILQ